MSTSASVYEEVIRSVETMTAAFHSGDLAGVLAAYEPGAAVAFAPGRAVSGQSALSEGFHDFFQISPRFSYSGHDVMVSGNLALHIAPWSMRGTAPDGSSIGQRGLSVAVLRRAANGKWQLVLDNPFGDRLLESTQQ